MPGINRNRAYWRKNLHYLAVLLGIWFTVSYLCSILLVDHLDRIRVGGAGLGFYFAQQASIWVFVILIFAYAALMNRLERKHKQRPGAGDSPRS
jgi:putative solute:sodium symporter small subunit